MGLNGLNLFLWLMCGERFGEWSHIRSMIPEMQPLAHRHWCPTGFVGKVSFQTLPQAYEDGRMEGSADIGFTKPSEDSNEKSGLQNSKADPRARWAISSS